MSEQARRVGRVDARKAARALTFFKVMAVIAGIALFVLIIVVVIHYGFGNAGPSHAWSPIHGLIYMVYVIATANLGFTMRWGVGKIIGIMLAGFVPFLPFWVERRIAREVDADLVAHSAR